MKAVNDFAVPFWDEFLTLEDLLSAFESDDPRLCSGDGWPWQQAAAYSLIGKPEKAIKVLNKLLEEEPASRRPMIEAALKRLSHPGT